MFFLLHKVVAYFCRGSDIRQSKKRQNLKSLSLHRKNFWLLLRIPEFIRRTFSGIHICLSLLIRYLEVPKQWDHAFRVYTGGMKESRYKVSEQNAERKQVTIGCWHISILWHVDLFISFFLRRYVFDPVATFELQLKSVTLVESQLFSNSVVLSWQYVCILSRLWQRSSHHSSVLQ